MTTDTTPRKATVLHSTADTLRIVEHGNAAYAVDAIYGIQVRGNLNRKAGMLRGAAALGSVAVVFGGIDTARGKSTSSEYVSAILSDAIFGALIGYFIAPRSWQRVPLPR